MPENPMPEAPAVTRSKHILIIEDDADLREALVEALRDEGYEAARSSAA